MAEAVHFDVAASQSHDLTHVTDAMHALDRNPGNSDDEDEQ